MDLTLRRQSNGGRRSLGEAGKRTVHFVPLPGFIAAILRWPPLSRGLPPAATLTGEGSLALLR